MFSGSQVWPGSCECVRFAVVLLNALFFALLFFALLVVRLIKIRKGYKPIHASIAAIKSSCLGCLRRLLGVSSFQVDSIVVSFQVDSIVVSFQVVRVVVSFQVDSIVSPRR